MSPSGSSPPGRSEELVDILVVCTGNIARSPFAEVLLREEAVRRLGPDPPVRVRSAGVHGLVGEPAVADMRALAAARGLDLSAHRGARADPLVVVDADLTIAMTSSQRAQLVRLAPDARDRVFTLGELVRLLPEERADGTVRASLRAAVRAAHRRRGEAARFDPSDDVIDPYGGSRVGYERCAADIEERVRVVAERLFGPA